jgi:hypothetical protein
MQGKHGLRTTPVSSGHNLQQKLRALLQSLLLRYHYLFTVLIRCII